MEEEDGEDVEAEEDDLETQTAHNDVFAKSDFLSSLCRCEKSSA